MKERSSFRERAARSSRGVWGHVPPENFAFLNPLRCHFLLSDTKFHFSLAADQTNNAYLKIVPKCCFLVCINKQVKFIKSSNPSIS